MNIQTVDPSPSLHTVDPSSSDRNASSSLNADSSQQSINNFLKEYLNGSYLNNVEESDLYEPCIMEDSNGHILTDNEWKKIREIINDYRSKIPQNRRTFK